MPNLKSIHEHMEVIGADGVHVGRVDRIEGDRIKLTVADSFHTRNEFDQAKWDDATRKVGEAYANEGYIYANVRPVVQRVQLNVLDAHAPSQLGRQGRLPGPARALDDDLPAHVLRSSVMA